MQTTQVNLGPVDTYKFFEDTQQIRLPGAGSYIELAEWNAANRTTIGSEDKVLSLISDSKKLVATMHVSFYHFYLDFVGRIIEQINKHPDTEIIIHRPPSVNEPTSGAYVFDSFLQTLDSKGIKYSVYNLSDYNVLEINNVYLFSHSNVPKNYPSAIFDFFSDYVRNPGITPHRDIFLSRRHMGNRHFGNAPEWAWANNDNRIDNHDKIEEYFSSIGYEVIVPETLNSFEEQMNTFYEARTIVSTTSSGLTNAVFMQPGQTMIELVTPLMIHVPKEGEPAENEFDRWTIQEELHHFYSVIALHKKHKFLMLGNKYRSSQEVIDQIEGDEFLKRFIVRK